MHTLVDIFSGAGGLSCGLEMSGFNSVLASDISDVFNSTYKRNHQGTKIISGDIRQLVGNQILKLTGLNEGELDLLAGGPPCQGFSVNAPIRSLDDPRNHLFKDYLRIAEILKPKVILIENVPGIVSLGRGTVIEQIYKKLQDIGYVTNHRILFAGHYGVPQLRFRTIIIATRINNKQISFPSPTHNADGVANFAKAKDLCIRLTPLEKTHLLDKTTAWQAISDLPEIIPGEVGESLEYKTPVQNEYQRTLRGNLKTVDNHYSSRLSKVNLERLKHIPQGGSWRDIPFDLLPKGLQRARRSDHTKRYGRLHPEQLCSTILTKCDPHWGSFFHPYQDRVLTVREAARIQSFPDTYKFIGSLTEQYQQVGNAVPPLMAKKIGEEVSKLLS